MRLNGRAAIVTGSGRGIGRAIALALAREGAEVVVCARTASDIDETARAIEELGRKALAIPADVTDAQQVEDMVARAIAEYGSIDILVNSAGGLASGFQGPDGKWSMPAAAWGIPEAVWDRMIAVNLKSVYLCIRAVMPHMIRCKRGDIVNIVSQAGRVPYPLEGSYAAAKHGAMALTETVGLQAAGYGIRVNAVSPGVVDTPGQRQAMAQVMSEDQFPPMDSPETVAAAVLYLLCDAPVRMTGQSLDLYKAVGGA